MVLSLAQLLDSPCTAAFERGHLELVSGDMPDELRALLFPVEAPVDAPAAASEPPTSTEPEKVESVPEPELEELIPEDLVPEKDETVAKHSAEELGALPYDELRDLAKSLALKSSGSGASLIQRILDHEAGVS